MLSSRMAGTGFIDAALERIDDPQAMAHALSGIPGVVEHGLFIGLAQTAHCGARPDGVKIVERSPSSDDDKSGQNENERFPPLSRRPVWRSWSL